MGRWIATILIGLLLALDVALPNTPIGRRGSEAQPRLDAPEAFAAVGQPMPDFAMRDLDGNPVRLRDYRGKRLILTLERSLDW